MLKKLDILFLNREDTETLLPYEGCIARMREAMVSVFQELVVELAWSFARGSAFRGADRRRNRIGHPL